jgi:hypothetical protein
MPTFTLFGGAVGVSLIVDSTWLTLGVQFQVSGSGFRLPAIWYESPAGATELPTIVALFRVSDTSLVHQEFPTWSGAAGSGRIRGAFVSPPGLSTGVAYKACVAKDAGSGSANWYGTIPHYWDSGAGAAGITNGPLSAPNNAGADHGQDSFHAAPTAQYPDGSFNATNYGVDPEIMSSGGQLLLATASNFI